MSKICGKYVLISSHKGEVGGGMGAVMSFSTWGVSGIKHREIRKLCFNNVF